MVQLFLPTWQRSWLKPRSCCSSATLRHDCAQRCGGTICEKDFFLFTQMSIDYQLSFWFLQFSQKTNENNSTSGTIHSSKVDCLVCFLGELKKTKRQFEINWPLGGDSFSESLTLFKSKGGEETIPLTQLSLYTYYIGFSPPGFLILQPCSYRKSLAHYDENAF